MQIVGNYVQLQTTNVVVDEIIWLKGYSYEADGGEGYFIGISSSASIPSSELGIIVPGPSTNTYWKRINFEYSKPEFWGARKDGISDDTQAIQSAINYSAYSKKTCLLSIGTYAVYNTLNIGVGSEVRNVTIKGHGRTSSIIKAQISNNFPVFNVSNAYYTTLEKFSINSDNSSGNGIDFKAPSSGGSFLPQYTKIKEVNISNFDGSGRSIAGSLKPASALYCERDLNTIVYDFVATGCNQGIVSIYSQQPTFSNVTIVTDSTNGLSCIALESTEMAKILNGDFVGTNIDSTYYSVISNLAIKNGHIIVYGGLKTVIDKCKFKNSVSREISLAYANGTSIKDCIIRMDTANSTGIHNVSSVAEISGNQFLFADNNLSTIGIYVDFYNWYGTFGNIDNNYFAFSSAANSIDSVIKIIGPSSMSRACAGNITNNNIITNNNTNVSNIIILNSGYIHGLNILNNSCTANGSSSYISHFLNFANVVVTAPDGVVVKNNYAKTYSGGQFTNNVIAMSSTASVSDNCKIEHDGIIKQTLLDNNTGQNIFDNMRGTTYNNLDGGFVISDGSKWNSAKFL